MVHRVRGDSLGQGKWGSVLWSKKPGRFCDVRLGWERRVIHQAAGGGRGYRQTPPVNKSEGHAPPIKLPYESFKGKNSIIGLVTDDGHRIRCAKLSTELFIFPSPGSLLGYLAHFHIYGHPGCTFLRGHIYHVLSHHNRAQDQIYSR